MSTVSTTPPAAAVPNFSALTSAVSQFETDALALGQADATFASAGAALTAAQAGASATIAAAQQAFSQAAAAMRTAYQTVAHDQQAVAQAMGAAIAPLRPSPPAFPPSQAQ
jgi:hypothetical protein